jgi:hypothetical protein
MIIYLNHDFTGGGTHFPKWNFTIAKPPIGTAVVCSLTIGQLLKLKEQFAYASH